MHVHLRLELSCSEERPPIGGTDEQESYVELNKEFDLPFAPFPGLSVQLSGVSIEDSDADAYEKALARDAPVTGIFTIERVLYRVEDGSFHVTASETYEPQAVMRAAIDQYVLGYGFTRDWLPHAAYELLNEILPTQEADPGEVPLEAFIAAQPGGVTGRVILVSESVGRKVVRGQACEAYEVVLLAASSQRADTVRTVLFVPAAARVSLHLTQRLLVTDEESGAPDGSGLVRVTLGATTL